MRNVVLVGPAGSGKTTLLEALLVRSGVLPQAGRVEDGTTSLDTDDVEIARGHSTSLAAAAVERQGVKLNLVDTPGTPDLVGELRAGLRACDAALFVVSAAGGLDARTAQLWEECAALGMPRAVVVSQLDRPRADFDETVALCQRLLGEDVHPLHVPMHADDGAVAGLIDLLRLRVSDWSAGEAVDREPDPEHVTLVEGLRSDLLEAVLAESEDETLLDHYLAGDPLDADLLVADFERAVARGHFHPALAVSPLQGAGTDELLDLLVGGFPSPLERDSPPVTRPDGGPADPLACDPAGPLAAQVVRTSTDPLLGRVSLVRVFSGTLRPDMAVHVSGHGEHGAAHDEDDRAGALAAPLGADQRPVPECRAGDLCAVPRLRRAETGDTLSSVDHPLLVGGWDLPDPQLPVALVASSPADEERLVTALARLVAEDPSTRLERRAETGQLLLWCVGEAHAEVLLEHLRGRHGAAVEAREVVVPLRETLAGPVTATGHVHQSGGHGQGVVVVVEAEPLAEGSGLVVEQRVAAGALPTAFHRSVERGVRAQAERGVTPGRPLVDLRVVLVEAGADADRPSDAAGQAAGAQALREAVAAAGVRVLEPWVELEVDVPSPFVGPVVRDLTGRRAHELGEQADPEHPDRVTVRAQAPEAELLTFAAGLRRASHGTGRARRRPLGHRPAPS